MYKSKRIGKSYVKVYFLISGNSFILHIQQIAKSTYECQTPVSAEDTAVNKTDENVHPHQACILMEGGRQPKVKY